MQSYMYHSESNQLAWIEEMMSFIEIKEKEINTRKNE